MRVTIVDLVVLILASFRLTHLVVFDQITAPVRNALKRRLGPLVSCFWCCGVWVSAGLALGLAYWPAVFRPLAVVFAVAGGQSFLEGLLWCLKSISAAAANPRAGASDDTT
ncbi:MAG: DUF1360 domain-containing protein [Bacillota bacterium]